MRRTSLAPIKKPQDISQSELRTVLRIINAARLVKNDFRERITAGCLIEPGALTATIKNKTAGGMRVSREEYIELKKHLVRMCHRAATAATAAIVASTEAA
jgi:hypothetical protein